MPTSVAGSSSDWDPFASHGRGHLYMFYYSTSSVLTAGSYVSEVIEVGERSFTFPRVLYRGLDLFSNVFCVLLYHFDEIRADSMLILQS